MASELFSQTLACQKVDDTTSNAETQLQDSFHETKNKNNHGDKKKETHQHHRRKPSKKKRKWKPYTKMTWEEKKAVEERETARADRIRGEMLNRGRPVAPYNTTQFLMAEHDPYEDEPVIDSDSKKGDESAKDEALNEESVDDAIVAEYTDSPHMAPEFILQDFSEAYERVQEENLATMSRNDLVKEHLSLERTLSYLQGKLAEEKTLNNSYSLKVQNIEEELNKLRQENQRLVRENVRLRLGDEAADNLGSAAEITSDYEYEVPLSDTDLVKYSEEYNDIEEAQTEGLTMNEVANGEDSASSSVASDRRTENSYDPDDCPSDESSDTKLKLKKRRQARDRRACRRVEIVDDTNSSYEDASVRCYDDVERRSDLEDDSSPARLNAEVSTDVRTTAASGDVNCIANPIALLEERLSVSKVEPFNDESMQSVATVAESMDGQSYPTDEKNNSVMMQSLSPET